MLTDTLLLLNKNRKELLDLSTRNTLIHYSKKRRQIDVVDEKSDSIFDILVNQGHKMSFEPLEEEKLKEVIEDNEVDISQLLSQPEEELDEKGYADRHYDNKLQTKLSPDKLQRSLLSIHNDSKTYIEEQGANILYLALGFLYWFESDNVSEARRAPLVLIPVSIDRKSARERFSLSYDGEEIGDNLSLAEKLRSEFSIEIPPIKEIDSFDVMAYFDQVKLAVEKEKRWQVDPHKIILGFFSFGKFLMYKDLDADKWSSTECCVLDALLNGGFRNESSDFGEDTNVDDIISPLNSSFIKDADSTQVLAVLDAKSGKNLAIQGPPGTGKSQTITNIIAEGLSDGKKILFVSEKMAALEVVKSRLDQSGLGDAVFELHSFKTNKKHVLGELDRVLNSGRPKNIENTYDIDEYLESRKRLNEYCQAVNSKIDGTQLSFVQALGKRSLIENPIVNDDSFPDINLQQDQYQKVRIIVQEITNYLKENGVPSSNPLSASQLTVYVPSDKADIALNIKQIISSIEQVMLNMKFIGEKLERSFSADKDTFNKIKRTADIAVTSPDLQKAEVKTDDWLNKRDEIVRFMNSADDIQKIYIKYRDRLIDEVWSQDLLQERKIFAAIGDKWWRILSGEYRRASRSIKGYLKGTLKNDNKAIIDMLDSIMSVQKQKPSVDESITRIEQIFNDSLDIMATEWSRLRVTSDWLYERHVELEKGEILSCIFDMINRPDCIADISEKCQQSIELLHDINEKFLYVSKKIMIVTNTCQDISDMTEILKGWLANIDYLDSVTYFNSLRDKLAKYGLVSIADKAFNWKYSNESFINAYDCKWLDEKLEQAFRLKPEIHNFNASGHKTKIKNFSEIDKKLMFQNCCKLAFSHHMSVPRGSDGEMSVIKTQINRKRNIIPIRKLIEKAGRAIQAIKPVFMMSPMSVATYLPPATVKFDMVIFDEASQVKPVDAFGAILRAGQTIVVGDKRQLPPTSFFEKISAESDNEDDFESTGDVESILNLFESKGALKRMLKWHYRSRHDSLIAVSNSKFYDNNLIIFPSPITLLDEEGLTLKYHPETIYDKGKTRTNQKEAEIIAKEIISHAKHRSNKSLGVVAFSDAQRNEIEAKLEILRKQDDSCENFFARDKNEPFFIKSLENVQGDERDFIFISIGYGKSADGILSATFGPLTKQGGERRLNVLISRAKHKMVVFSNFKASEMDLRNSQSIGNRSLKYFLEFAETKRLEQPYSTGLDTDSPFEDAVIKALNDRGIETEPQIGTAGYRIDIGIKHPDFPGKYILGIECDGAMYHSASSARDRDRLRQEVLENLGWTIHRIWSTDWYKSPEKEIDKAIDAIKKAAEKNFYNEVEIEQTEAEHSPVIAREDAVANNEIGVLPYIKAEIVISLYGRDFHNLTIRELVPHIIEIVEVESPIHIDELTRRLRLAADIQKAGARIQQLVADACRYAHQKGNIRLSSSFLWDASMTVPSVRDRSSFDNQEKKIDYISDEEIEEAIKMIVQQSFSISENDLITKTANILGFARTTGKIADYIKSILKKLINMNEFDINGNMVSSN